MSCSKTNLDPTYQLLSVFSSRTCSNTSLLRSLSYKELWNLFLPWAFACKAGIVFCWMCKLVPSPSSHISTWLSGYERFCAESQPANTWHVWFCPCCYSSCFHVFYCHLCRLNVINHSSHLAFSCHVSSLDACQITIALPFTSCKFTLYLQCIPHPILFISPGGHLEPPSRLTLSLPPCSTWSLAETETTAPLLSGHVFWCPPEAINTFHCSQCLCPALWCSQIYPRHRSAVHRHWPMLQWREFYRSAWCVE